MVITILSKTTKVIQSEKDAQILYTKSIELLLKLLRLLPVPARLYEMFADKLKSSVDKIKSNLSKSRPKPIHESLKTQLETAQMQLALLKNTANMMIEFSRFMRNE
jgi:hypothetical protein